MSQQLETQNVIKMAEIAETEIPPLADFGPTKNLAMERVEKIRRLAHALATMVQRENLTLATGQADLIRSHQTEKDSLCAAYLSEMETLSRTPPQPEEREEARIHDLKLLAQKLQSILNTHLYMAEVAISATAHIINGIREEVSTANGANIRYNEKGKHGACQTGTLSRNKSVAVHTFV